MEISPANPRAAWLRLKRYSMRKRRSCLKESRPMSEPTDRPKDAVHQKYERLIKSAGEKSTIKVAIVHPCDKVSLESAVEAARLHLIDPVLVGPAERIRAVA